MALPNLVDLKTQLNIDLTDSTDDDELQLHLDAAIGVVEGIVGPLSGKTVTETHYGASGPLLVLRQAPVQSVTSVAVRFWAGALAVPGVLTDYVLDPEVGTLRLASGWQFRGDVTVTYVAGQTAVPAQVLLATLVIAAHMWETQRGVSPTQLQTPDFVAGPSGAGYAVPNRAAELLESYAQHNVA